MMTDDSVEQSGSCEIFISHSTRPMPDRRQLTDDLVGALCRRGLSVYLDRTRLEVDEPVYPQLDAAIERARIGVVILTHRYLESQWCMLELETMTDRRAAGRMRLFVLRLDPECALPPGFTEKDVIEPVSPIDLTALANQVERILRQACYSSPPA